MSECGTTLIELVIVIAIAGIIATAVAVLVARPVEGYMDASRRAELSDIADTALRRITRDLRTALPNSIRITEEPPLSGILYLEYLQTSGGARYRADPDEAGAGNILDFTAADSSFDVIGTMPTISPGEWIVIYNDPSPPANAYEDPPNNNRQSCADPCSSGNTINLSAAKKFPLAAPGKRFQVVQYAVTYVCNPNPDTRELRRYWDYGISASQPTPPTTPPLPATLKTALLATDIKSCSFIYAGATQRSGVVSLTLEVERSGEVVRLFQQAHVNNVP